MVFRSKDRGNSLKYTLYETAGPSSLSQSSPEVGWWEANIRPSPDEIVGNRKCFDGNRNGTDLCIHCTYRC